MLLAESLSAASGASAVIEEESAGWSGLQIKLVQARAAERSVRRLQGWGSPTNEAEMYLQCRH